MFKLKRPCANCPFRKGCGETFALGRQRVEEIVEGVAFQCHKSIDYKPQQCAGLMSLLHRAGKPNQIMQVAQRLAGFDASGLDHADVYATIEDAIEAHEKHR